MLPSVISIPRGVFSSCPAWLLPFLLFLFFYSLAFHYTITSRRFLLPPEETKHHQSSADAAACGACNSSEVEERSYADAFHYMDALALQAHTDKSSAWHNYTRVYCKYFAGMRHQSFTFLEFGIDKGESVKMWEAYFPNANLHFAEIDKSRIKYHSQRSHYHYLNQSDEAALNALGDEHGPFDVIIDDASHLQEPTITTFKAMLPHLRPGGFYVIEDVHTSYWREFGGGGDNAQPLAGADTAVQLAKDLVDEVNFFVAASHFNANPSAVRPDARSRMSYFSRRIDAVHFYPGLTFLITREEEI